MDVLSNGQVIRHSVTGKMLFTGIRGEFIKYLDSDEDLWKKRDRS